MCVRTLIGNEMEMVPTTLHAQHELKDEQFEKWDKLIKAKGKHMKLHDEVILKERKFETSCQRETKNDLSMTEISEDFLVKFAIKFRALNTEVFRWYSTLQQAKFYK